MKAKTTAILATTLAGAALLYLLAKDGPRPEVPDTGTKPLAHAPPAPQPEAAPAAPDAQVTTAKLAQLAATILPDGDDEIALKRLHTEVKFTEAAQIIALIKTRAFPERERGIYYALSDEFGRLATRADVALVADTYRQMPAGEARDDMGTLLRNITRRDLLGPLATILQQSVQPGVREPALLAGAAYAIAKMATPPETELLLQTATKADAAQLNQ